MTPVHPTPYTLRELLLLDPGSVFYQAHLELGAVLACTLNEKSDIERAWQYPSFQAPTEPLSHLSVTSQMVESPLHHGYHFFATAAEARTFIEDNARENAPGDLVVGDLVLITGCRTVPSDYVGTVGVIEDTHGTYVSVQLKTPIGIRGRLSHGASISDLKRVGRAPELLERVAQTGFAPEEGDA